MWAVCRVLATLTTRVCLLAAFVDVIAICARATARIAATVTARITATVVVVVMVFRSECAAVVVVVVLRGECAAVVVVVVLRSECAAGWGFGEDNIGRDETKAVPHRTRRPQGETSQPRKQHHKLHRQGGFQVEVILTCRGFQELERCLWQLEPGL